MSLGREEKLKRFHDDINMDNLWEVLLAYAGGTFFTAKGLEFSYTIRGGEMFVDRKEKSITKASVEIAYKKAIELDRVVTGPKKLGVFGASYLYPVFLEIGFIRRK